MLSRGRDFADLRLPVAVVATDLERGEEVVLKSGPVAEAVRASSSIPGVFAPIRLDGRLLVDGAVLNRLPIKLAKEMGAEIVIASDVGWEVGERKITNIFDVIMQSFDIAQKELTQYIIPTADVLIAPELSHIPMLAMEQSAQCIHAGTELPEAIPASKSVWWNAGWLGCDRRNKSGFDRRGGIVFVPVVGFTCPVVISIARRGSGCWQMITVAGGQKDLRVRS